MRRQDALWRPTGQRTQIFPDERGPCLIVHKNDHQHIAVPKSREESDWPSVAGKYTMFSLAEGEREKVHGYRSSSLYRE